MKIGIAGPIATKPLVKNLNESKIQDVPPGLGGYSVVPIVDELLLRGHEVTVFSLDRTINREVCLKGDNLTLLYGPFRSAKRMRDFFQIERTYLKQAILRNDCQFVHAHWTYEYAMAAIASGKPHLITCRDSAIHILRFNKDPYRFGRLLMNLYVLRKATRLSAVSEHIKKAIKPFARAPIAIVPNGIIDQAFYKDNNKVLDLSRPIVATVLNGWGRLKNSKSAIIAFSLLKKRVPAVNLIMFGNGFEPYGPAREWAKKKRIEEGIAFIGPLAYDELMQAFDENGIHVLLHPSLEESFGMVLIEALAKRIPVIGGVKSGGVPWVLDNGSAGLLVDVTSPDEMADAMFRLISDSNLWKKSSENGYESVRKRFHIKIVVDQYEELYKQLV